MRQSSRATGTSLVESVTVIHLSGLTRQAGCFPWKTPSHPGTRLHRRAAQLSKSRTRRSRLIPGPIDSFALNGKLYLSERRLQDDARNGYDPDDFNPAIKTPQALESVHWRGVGAALAHGSGICWMDLWGNGWLKTASVWNRAGAVRKR